MTDQKTPLSEARASTHCLIKCKQTHQHGTLFGWGVGYYIERFTEECSGEYEEVQEYSEKHDEYCWKEGWYIFGPGEIDDYFLTSVKESEIESAWPLLQLAALEAKLAEKPDLPRFYEITEYLKQSNDDDYGEELEQIVEAALQAAERKRDEANHKRSQASAAVVLAQEIIARMESNEDSRSTIIEQEGEIARLKAATKKLKEQAEIYQTTVRLEISDPRDTPPGEG